MNVLGYVRRSLGMLILLLAGTVLSAQDWQNPAERYRDVYKKYVHLDCPIPRDSIQHFMYVARDREAIRDHPFLDHSRFAGAQIMYAWKALEPQKGSYDFSLIEEDYQYLKAHGKKLFIQLQDATFSPQCKAIPSYLLSDEYQGGAIPQYHDDGSIEGWTAKRWNPEVQERFRLLLLALGREFDGKIEGINLQETSIGVSTSIDSTFTEDGYFAALKARMLALKQGFPTSTTMIYANFMPGEWLPWEDKGYLKGIYQYGEEIGVGFGAPDLMVQRKGQLNHALALMHEGNYSVPLGIAVQDGNYIGKTGADADYKEDQDTGSPHRKSIIPLLQGFAKDFLGVSYMFWVNQAPYFQQDVLPCFEEE